MSEWINPILDVILIAAIVAGVWQTGRLIAQLRDLRASRADMDRFVRDFNTAVMRAEAGIKSLRAAARESGDDLEKLVEKAVMVRDELNFIVESADNVAERLTISASQALHIDKTAPVEKKKESAPPSQSSPVAAAPAASRAEKELLQALQKMK